MDWDRAQQLVSSHDRRFLSDLNMRFLFDFLTQLFKALQNCTSVDHCAFLYPQAGPLLTLMAAHPFIGIHKPLATLVIECVLEYTKYNFEVSGPISRSSQWCMERLRRIHQHQTDEEERIGRMVGLIQTRAKHDLLAANKLNQLGDLALELIDDDKALPILETLFDAALLYPSTTPIFSSRFVNHLLASKYDHWPITLRTKCWRAIPPLFEMQWMDWIERSLLEEGGYYDNDTWMQLGPELMQVSFGLIATWMANDEVADWRILGLWQVVCNLRHQQPFIPSLQWDDPEQAYKTLIAYIYGGSPLEILERRNRAWLASMMSCDTTARWMDAWLGWTLEEGGVTVEEKMAPVTLYIAWLICPSLDERMTAYHRSLDAWIHSFKGFDQVDPMSCPRVTGFLDEWYVLTNGNLPVGASLLGSMIHHSRNWTTNQCTSMIDRFIEHANLQQVPKSSVTEALVNRFTMVDDPRMNTLIPYLHSA